MNKLYGRDILRFFVLILVQVLVLDHINLYGFANPGLYIYFILLLPFEIPGFLLLLLAFLIGFGVDSFSNSIGLHTFATVLIAYLRPWVIRLAGPPAEYEGNLKPGIADMGFRWFFAYSMVLVVAHQLVLYTFESLRLAEIGIILLKTITGSILTLALIIVVEYLFMRKR
ncbi:MAG: rod shape-determining protein [Bacteroidetes bacterium]|nr:MAG: rod shape-determining protein [Bacteroidota bacterium]